jgi:hypothetical protein
MKNAQDSVTLDYTVNTLQNNTPECVDDGPSYDPELTNSALGTSLGERLSAVEDEIPDAEPVAPPSRVDDMTDENDPHSFWCQPFPKECEAGAFFGTATTSFQDIEEELIKHGEVWGPFQDEDEWELAKWLIKNVGHNQADAFLKLPIVSTTLSLMLNLLITSKTQKQTQPSFENKNDFLAKIDALPQGYDWRLDTLKLEGDLCDDEGARQSENVELWYRDPIDCIRELISNPAFRESLRYAPEKMFAEEEGNEEVFNEMWTAEWWWKVQVSQR